MSIDLARLQIAFQDIPMCPLKLGGDEHHVHYSDIPKLIENYDAPLSRRRTIPDCLYCADISKNSDHFPWHDPSPNCESGKHLHCACDVCF